MFARASPLTTVPLSPFPSNWLCGLWHSGTGFHPGTWVPSSSYKGFPSGQTYSWYIHACQALPESGYFWENGYNRNHGTQRTPTTLPGRMRLGGAAPHYDARSAAEVAEVLIYRRVLSDQEMYNVNAYLQQRYRLVKRCSTFPPPALAYPPPSLPAPPTTATTFPGKPTPTRWHWCQPLT